MLTDIDLALADADALILMSDLRSRATTGYSLGSETGFSILTRAITRNLKRILTGNAGTCYAGCNGANADAVIFALLANGRKPRATDINGRTDR